MTEPVITASRLTMRFGAFTAVDDVSFQVAPGEIVGLLGANGAGKTTLIRILLGLLAPSQGESTLLGGAAEEHRRHLGYVPQGLGLYPDLTARENVAFVAQMYGVASPPVPDGNALVRELGLGRQRQLAFSCALLHAPTVLVLDEPTSGVGALARAELWDIIHEQAARGVGVLVTTHYMQEAQQCHRLLLLSAGRLVATGSEADIVGDTRAVAVQTSDWATTFEVLHRVGLTVTLAGRNVRVVDADQADVVEVLRRHGLPGQVRSVPATIEERMTVLSRAAG